MVEKLPFLIRDDIGARAHALVTEITPPQQPDACSSLFLVGAEALGH